MDTVIILLPCGLFIVGVLLILMIQKDFRFSRERSEVDAQKNGVVSPSAKKRHVESTSLRANSSSQNLTAQQIEDAFNRFLNGDTNATHTQTIQTDGAAQLARQLDAAFDQFICEAQRKN